MKSSVFPVLLSLLLAAGCTHQKFVTDARHPEIEISRAGVVTFRGEKVDPDALADELEKAGFTSADTINVRIEAEIGDREALRVPYYVMGRLGQRGFRRTILVRERKTASDAPKKRPAQELPAPAGAAPRIRYKN